MSDGSGYSRSATQSAHAYTVAVASELHVCVLRRRCNAYAWVRGRVTGACTVDHMRETNCSVTRSEFYQLPGAVQVSGAARIAIPGAISLGCAIKIQCRARCSMSEL